jgi:hypothetical protein
VQPEDTTQEGRDLTFQSELFVDRVHRVVLRGTR